jgi:hypothetical protein
MNYLGESEFTPDIKSILERLAVLEADQPADLPSACLIQNMNPAGAVLGSNIAGDSVYRPILGNVTPGAWPNYFSRRNTPNVGNYGNDNSVLVELEGWYHITGSVVLKPDADCQLSACHSRYEPGESIATWEQGDGKDDQVVTSGSKVTFQFSSLTYCVANSIIEITFSNRDLASLVSIVSIYKYRLSVTRV